MNFRPRHFKTATLEADEIFVDAAVAADMHGGLERHLERPINRIVSLVFLALILAGMGYLASRAAALQIRGGRGFFAEAQQNRFSVRPIFAPRGMITDEFGDSLVENIPAFGLSFDRAAFTKAGGDFLALDDAFASVFKKNDALRVQIRDNLFAADLPGAPNRMILARDIPPDLLVDIAARADDLPGVQIFESWRRAYKDSYAFSHLIGFAGKVSPEDIRKNPDIADEETAGKSGLEAFYDSFLRGIAGKKIVEVDSHGVATRYKLAVEPVSGNTLSLAVDGGLQDAAYKIVQGYTEGKRAATVVAVDPRSGAIRALVSSPGFDAGKFGTGLSAQEFNAVLRDPLTPLFNRALAGEFPSGSTIKPLLAAAALQEKIVDPEKKIYDEGFLALPNPFHPGMQSIFPDWRPQGWVNMYDAIAISANVYFYMIGGGWRDQQGLGIERIGKYERAFGLGALSGIDMPGERPGLIPGPEWKKTAEPADPAWRIGDTYNVSIGQGGTKVTPLQMAMAVAAIANGGTLRRPFVVDHISDEHGAIVSGHTPVVVREHIISPENLAVVARGMRQTVTAGTAHLLQDIPMPIAAKTGTAQSAPGRLPHAWVTTFAPADNPEIVLVVMVEYAGEGATVAVPITNDIYQWYVGHRRN